MKKGRVVYIQEPLSYFRQYSGRNQKEKQFIFMTIGEWIELIIDAYNSGFLNDEQDYKECLTYCLENAVFIMKDAVRGGQLNEIDNGKIEKALNKVVTRIFEKEVCYCQYCNQQFAKFSLGQHITIFQNINSRCGIKIRGFVRYVIRWIVKGYIVFILKWKLIY